VTAHEPEDWDVDADKFNELVAQDEAAWDAFKSTDIGKALLSMPLDEEEPT
jgi:hypothetical protein